MDFLSTGDVTNSCSSSSLGPFFTLSTCLWSLQSPGGHTMSIQCSVPLQTILLLLSVKLQHTKEAASGITNTHGKLTSPNSLVSSMQPKLDQSHHAALFISIQ